MGSVEPRRAPNWRDESRLEDEAAAALAARLAANAARSALVASSVRKVRALQGAPSTDFDSDIGHRHDNLYVGDQHLENQKLQSLLRAPAVEAPPHTWEPEPVRDRALGPISVHRIRTVVWMGILAWGLFALQNWWWPVGVPATSGVEQAWAWGSLIWVAPLPAALLGFAGLLWYRPPRGLDLVAPIDNLVCFRIVSRGDNVEALLATVARCRQEMAVTPLFPHVIEVVTEEGGRCPDLGSDDVRHLVVPASYRTPNRSLFKARALQYALDVSPLTGTAWLVHLDEESHPTRSSIKGIAQAIAEEEASGRLRIGQGAIIYHRQWATHRFLTMADMIRTGDDLSRFYLQHRLGVTLFGLHGSYIVVRNDVERAIGFDFGPAGSITEDCFWALVAMESGQRARWVDGYVEEQSCHSALDFIKQRRRWWQGVARVVLRAPVQLRYRLALGIFTAVWTIAPFALLYTMLHFFWAFEVNEGIRWGANFTFAYFILNYLIGLKVNLDERGSVHPIRRLGLYIRQILLVPVFGALEGAGVIYALVRPSTGFHVVSK